MFRLAPNQQNGHWNFRVLYNFASGDAFAGYPQAALTFDRTGALYGPRKAGGDFGYGFVYKLSPVSFRKWLLHPDHFKPVEARWKRGRGPSTAYGIILRGSDNDLVRNNVSDTISVDSDNNVIVNNTASDNGGGIFVEGSNNDIHANTTNNNSGGNGTWVILGSLGNNITGNTAEGNSPYDLEDDNLNCGTNTWEGNKFANANMSCIQ